jgi:ketosteroid isomerase-like protein
VVGEYGSSALILVVLPMTTVNVEIVGDATPEQGKAAAEAILGLEDSAMERWRQGDPMRWVEISADEVTYVDPSLRSPVVGKEAYARYVEPLRGRVHYDGSEYVKPRIALYDDTAVLTYNYHSLRKDKQDRLQRTSFWNTTEVYHVVAGEWRIVHTHWSYIRHRLPDSLDAAIPIVMKAVEPAAGAAGELMRLEAGAMERWRKGDPFGFLEISAPEVTYFDTGTPTRLDGLDQLTAEYETRTGKIHYDVMEFIEPRIQTYGDTAVLFYRFFSTVLNPDGTVKSRTPWNCTEVYAKRDGAWKIVHTHWSYINGVRERGGI